MANPTEIPLKVKLDVDDLAKGSTSAATSIKKIEESTQKVADANLLVKVATEKLQEAQAKLDQARKSGNQDAIKSAESRVDKLQKEETEAVKALEQEIAAYKKLKDAQDKAAQRDNKKLSLGDEKSLESASKGISQVSLAVDKLVSSLGTSGSPLEAFKSGLESIGALAGPEGEAITRIINSLITGTQVLKGYVDEANEARKIQSLFADISGLKPETVESFELAAKSIGGTTVQVIQLTDRFAALVNKAKEGDEKSLRILEKFKIGAQDLNKPLNDLLNNALEAFDGFKAGAEKADLSFQAFGLRGSKTASELSQNLKEFRNIVKESGILFDEKQTEALKKYSAATIELSTIFRGLEDQLGAELAPTFTELEKSAISFIKSLKADPAFVANIKEIIAITEKLISTFGKIALQEFQKLAKDVDNVVTVFKVLEKVLSPITDVFEKLGGAISKTSGLLKNLFSTDLEIFSKVISKLKDDIRELDKQRPDLNLEKSLGQFINLQKEVKETGKSLDDLGKNFKGEDISSLQEAAENYELTLKKLIETNKELGVSAKASAEERLAGLKIEADEGNLKESETARRKAEINQDLNNKLLALADEQVAKAQEAFNKTGLLEKELTKLKEEAETLKGQVAQKAASDRIAIERATANEIKAANQQAKSERLADIQSELAEIKKAEDSKDKTHTQAAQLRREISLKEIQTEIDLEKSLSQNANVSEKDREESRKRLSDLIVKQAEIERVTESDVQKAIVKDTENANAARIASEKETQAKIKGEREQAAIEERKRGDSELEIAKRNSDVAISLINREIESRKKTIESLESVRAEESKINAERAAIANLEIQRNKAVNDSIKEQESIKSALAEQVAAQSKAEFDQKIIQLKNAGATAEQIALATANFEIEQQKRIIEAIKTRIEVEKSVNGDGTGLIKLRTDLINAEDKLGELTQNRGELIKKEQGATNALTKDQQLGNETFAKGVAQSAVEVQKLGDRASSAAGNLQAMASGFAAIAQQFAFAFDPNNLEAAHLRLEQLKKDFEEISQETFLKGFPPALELAKELANSAIEELSKKIADATIAAQSAAVQKASQIALEEKRRASEVAFNIVKQEKEGESKLSEEFAAKEKDLTNQINQNKLDAAIELDQLKQEQAKKLEAFDNEENKKELERADQQHEALLEKEANFEAQREATKNKAEEEGAKKKSDAARKAADIDLELQDLLKKRNNENDPTKKKDLDNQIKQKQAELANADAAEKDRATRETRRQQEIAKAQEAAKEKVKGAKSADEVTEIEKELGIQIDGINEKFANEQKYAEDLAKYQGKVSQERLDAITAAYKAEQVLVDQRVKDRIDAEKRQNDLVEAARKKAEDKEKADAEARRQKLIDDQKKEYDDRKTAFENKQTQLENALKTERESYKTHLEELRTKTAQSLADIASSFTDGGAAAEKFFKDFAANAGLTGKAIDDILSKLKQFKDQAASDNQQQNNAAGSPGSNNNGQQNNGVGNNFGGNGQPQGHQQGNGGGLGPGFGGSGNSGFGLTVAPQDQASNTGNTKQTNNQNSNSTSNNTSNQNQSNNSANSSNSNNSNTSNDSISNTISNLSSSTNTKNQELNSPATDPVVSDVIKTAKEFSKTMTDLFEAFYVHIGLTDQTKSYTQSEIGAIGERARKFYPKFQDNQFKVLDSYIGEILRNNPDGRVKARGYAYGPATGYVPYQQSDKTFKVEGRKICKQFIKSVIDRWEPLRATQQSGDKTPTDDKIPDPPPPKSPKDTPGGDGKSIDKGDLTATSDKIDDGIKIINKPGSNAPPGAGQKGNNNVPTFDRSQETTSFEGEGASKKGFVSVAPDAAVGGSPNKPNQANNQTPNASKPTLTDKDKPLAQVQGQPQPQNQAPSSNDNVPNQAINQNNNNQVTVNLQVQGFLGDKKTINQLEDLFSNLMNQQDQINQNRLRQLNGASLARRG